MVMTQSHEHPFVHAPLHQRLDTGPGCLQNSSSSSVFHDANARATSFDGQPAPPLARNTSSLSRKRSREEALLDEDAQGDQANAPNAPAASTPAPAVEEPIYGEGMVLLNPHTGMALSAESQTGTWYEEKVECAAAAAPPLSSRSVPADSSDYPSRKAQRLDASAPGLDDISLASIRQRLHGSWDDQRPRAASRSGSGSPQEPQVDEATCLLGISWQRVHADDSDMAAAIRGWTKYIDNQFSSHLRDSEILMKNRALNAYLVTACPTSGKSFRAFYLFTEDLSQAQLVASSWDSCLQNLRSAPMVFEGAQIMRAADRAFDQPPAALTPVETGSQPLMQFISAPDFANNECVNLNAGIVAVGSGMDIDA